MEAQREKIVDQVAIDAVIEILQADFGDLLSQAQAVCERFGKD